LLIAFAVCSCSTTKLIPEGNYKLSSNTIRVQNDSSFKVSTLEPYLKQKPAGWNPMNYVYHWSSGKGTKWDKFAEKLGQPPVIFDSTQVAASRKSLLNHLEYSGYYYSTVESKVSYNKKKAKVEYFVNLGRRYVIDSVDFKLRDTLMAKMFDEDSANVSIKAGDYLSEKNLDSESERLAQMYRNNGYYGFTKNYFFFTADTTKNPGHCNLEVILEDYTRNESPNQASPHKQYRIGEIEIKPEQGFNINKKFVEGLCVIEPGMLYSEEKINKTYERISSIQVINSVNMNMNETDSSTVDCLVLLKASKLQSIKFNLEASYNSNSLFGIAPALTYSHRNMFLKGGVLDVGLKGNFQFKFNDPAKSTEFTISTNLSLPRLLLIPNRVLYTRLPKTDISLAFNYQDRPEYTRDIFSLTYGYTWNIGPKVSIQFNPLRANIVKIFNMSEEFKKSLKDPYMIDSYSDHFDLGGRLSFYFSTDPSAQPKHTYFYTRWQNNFSGNVLSLFNNLMKQSEETGQRTIFGIPYSQFYRTELSVVQTFKFGEENRLALAGRLLGGIGFGYGNSTALPFEQLFYSGGSTSLRGWQARSVGPGSAPIDTTFSIYNQSGNMRLEANLEFRFPLFWKFEGGLFVDAGNVWLAGGDKSTRLPEDEGKYFDLKTMFKTSALDWGIGARLDFGMILVRVDMGLKTYDPVRAAWLGPSDWFRKDGYALHFGIGYPF